MSSFLNSILKELKNEYATIAENGTTGDITQYIDTGSYTLNAALSGSIFGGIPSNKVTAFAGESTTGKTFFTLGVVKNFLDSDPTAIVFIFESESAITKQMLVERGIDVSRTAMIPVETVEQFKNQSLLAVDRYLESKKNGVPVMFVLDSLGMLSTNKEMEDSAAGKDVKDMTRAQIVKAAFRVLTLKLGKANIPMLVTNHVYEQVGQMYADKEMGGGSGLKYAASTTIFLTKAKARGEDAGGGSADKSVIGSIITCTAKKSRLTREGTKVKTMLTHDKGLNRWYGLFELALDSGVFIKDGNNYRILDGEEKIPRKRILGNPAKYYTTEVLNAIDEYVKKTFTYSNLTEDEVMASIIGDDDGDDDTPESFGSALANRDES